MWSRHLSFVVVALFHLVIFWLHLQHREAPRPGIKPTPQQQPRLLSGARQILTCCAPRERLTPIPSASLSSNRCHAGVMNILTNSTECVCSPWCGLDGGRLGPKCKHLSGGRGGGSLWDAVIPPWWLSPSPLGPRAPFQPWKDIALTQRPSARGARLSRARIPDPQQRDHTWAGSRPAASKPCPHVRPGSCCFYKVQLYIHTTTTAKEL